jgi:hypothetical protein
MSSSRPETAEVFGVERREVTPLVRDLVFGEDCVNGAGLDARVAVDALLRVDVEHLDGVVVGLVGRGMDAIDRAHLDAELSVVPMQGSAIT